MTPEELALYEALIAMGMSPQDAAATMAAMNGMGAPDPIRPPVEPSPVPGGQLGTVLAQMQQGSGNQNRGPLDESVPISAGTPMRTFRPSVIDEFTNGTLFGRPFGTSGNVGNYTGGPWASPLIQQEQTEDSMIGEATLGGGDINPWLADDNTGWYAPNANPPGPEYPRPDEKDRRVYSRPEAGMALRDLEADLMDMLGEAVMRQQNTRPTPAKQDRNDTPVKKSAAVTRMSNAVKSSPKPSTSRATSSPAPATTRGTAAAKTAATAGAAERFKQLTGR